MHIYMCIDLKSFFASVECVERHLDPLKTNLVVADEGRTDKTICLAVTPPLKKYGIPGRVRLFELKRKIKEINKERMKRIRYKGFSGKSTNEDELNDPYKELGFIIAKPKMSNYIKYSTLIYKIYLKYVSVEDIFVYSIDEVFCDITHYLKALKMTPREFTTMIIHDVYKETGITATAGLGTNLYLAKIAMDITAKHAPADKYGVRIAALDEQRFRRELWSLKPLTKFWRIGPGICKRLESYGMYTMGDIAKMSIVNEDLLYKVFGVNAEILIDHAWGYEPCTIKDVKAYKPASSSVSTAQVLHCPYSHAKAKIIVQEMIDALALELTYRKVKTNLLTLTINYDSCLIEGETELNYYGKEVPKSSHSSINIGYYTSSSDVLIKNILRLYDTIVKRRLFVKKISVCACNVIPNVEAKRQPKYKQLSIFDTDTRINDEDKDEKVQEAILKIREKYGKNAVLKAMSLEEGATMRERNKQIGGHSE